MKLQTSLRALFTYDPFEHSGIYDGYATSLYWSKKGPTKSRKVGAHYRCLTSRELKTEQDLEAAIVRLVLVGVTPKKKTLGEASRVLRKCHTVLVGTGTLEALSERVEEAYLTGSRGLRGTPPTVKPIGRLLTLPGVAYAPHPSVPDGVMVGFKHDPEFTGLINGPDFFPYPAGVALWRPDQLVALKVSLA